MGHAKARRREEEGQPSTHPQVSSRGSSPGTTGFSTRGEVDWAPGINPGVTLLVLAGAEIRSPSAAVGEEVFAGVFADAAELSQSVLVIPAASPT